MILDRIKEQLDKRQRGMTGGSRLIGDQNPPSPPDEPPVRAREVETPEAALVERLQERMTGPNAPVFAFDRPTAEAIARAATAVFRAQGWTPPGGEER